MKMVMYSNFNNEGKFKSSNGGWFGKLAALFIIVPLFELWLLIRIGSVIGSLETILLVIVTGVLGAFLMKAEGARVWLEFQRSLARREIPKDGIIDGLLILFGGVVLMTPGVITDVFGLLCIVPVTRHLIRGYVQQRLTARFTK